MSARQRQITTDLQENEKGLLEWKEVYDDEVEQELVKAQVKIDI